ncbi:hypothetical protein KI387_035848, partial [Taxus chinensis]
GRDKPYKCVSVARLHGEIVNDEKRKIVGDSHCKFLILIICNVNFVGHMMLSR